jgi:hypothetical protein
MLAYCELVAKHGVWLSLGGYHVLSHERLGITHVIVIAEGSIVTSYRKHLFDVCIADGSFRDGQHRGAGRGSWWSLAHRVGPWTRHA